MLRFIPHPIPNVNNNILYMREYIIFLFLLLADCAIDDNFYKCKTLSGKVFLIGHHILDLYRWFGSFLFPYYLVHFVLVVGFIIGWHLFGGCFLVPYVNKLCGLHKSCQWKSLMKTLLQKTGNSEKVEYLLTFIILAYDLYFILKL